MRERSYEAFAHVDAVLVGPAGENAVHAAALAVRRLEAARTAGAISGVLTLAVGGHARAAASRAHCCAREGSVGTGADLAVRRGSIVGLGVTVREADIARRFTAGDLLGSDSTFVRLASTISVGDVSAAVAARWRGTAVQSLSRRFRRSAKTVNHRVYCCTSAATWTRPAVT